MPDVGQRERIEVTTVEFNDGATRRIKAVVGRDIFSPLEAQMSAPMPHPGIISAGEAHRRIASHLARYALPQSCTSVRVVGFIEAPDLLAGYIFTLEGCLG